ncbi:MAG: MFS transporter [Candidatus Methanoperedens sp.]|nr:MFS transporter [Candidatus Methanoperedens sp.]
MRLNAIQLLINSSIMMSNLFIPIFATELHASGTQIGIIGACYGAALFLSTYIFSRASDNYPPKTLLYAGFLSSSITFFIQMYAYDPVSLAIFRAMAGFSAGIYPAVLMLYVYNLKRSIGKFSSFMPLGWALGNLLAGVIAVIWEIFAVASLLFALSFLLTLTLPQTEAGTRKKTDFFSLELLKKNWNIYFGFFLRQIGANGVWLIFPLYLAGLGANKFWIGIIYMLNPSLQFFIMRRLDRFKNSFLIHTGDMLSVVAFLVLIPLTIYYQAILGLALIAFSYSFLFVGSTNELLKNNDEKGAAAGLLNSSIAFASILGSLIGGIIFEKYGFHAVLASGAFFALIGYVVMLLADRSRIPEKSS